MTKFACCTVVSNARCEKHRARAQKNAFLIALERVFLSIHFCKTSVSAPKLPPIAFS
jgi:hypothetical protein